MKKSISVFLAALLLSFSISGCSNDTDSSKVNSSTDSSVTESVPNDSSASDTENNENSSDTDSTPEASAPDDTDTSEDTESEDNNSGIGGSTEIPELSLQRSEIVDTAKSLIGIDYAFSEASPEKGFDNSGFIYYVLRENGYINCPRGTEGQLTMGTKIDYDEVLPGDVVFFSDKDEESGEKLYFGGIYVGDGQLIYSPYPGEKVKYGDYTNSYWKESFEFGIKIA
ncbi:MAG: C40 family peptidase [Ruminiclostridium sp.]|nr:C40 family peptidase [Ruminiclostridium sp.]